MLGIIPWDVPSRKNLSHRTHNRVLFNSFCKVRIVSVLVFYCFIHVDETVLRLDIWVILHLTKEFGDFSNLLFLFENAVDNSNELSSFLRIH